MCVDDGRAGSVLTLRQPVDDQVVDARLAECDGQGETGGAGTDDQHIGTGGKHGDFPFCQRTLTFYALPLRLSTCVEKLRGMTERISKSDRTRAAILAAARDLFGTEGYERTTVREVAARAGIDPALVIRYFGSKDGLFVRASVFDLRLLDLSTIEPRELGPTLVRHFLDVWEGPDSNGGMTILLRSAASNPLAAEKLQEVFACQVLPALVRLAGPADGPQRAGLVASQLLGLALSRYVLKLPAVVALTRERIVRDVGATLQRYLDGDA